MAPDDEKTEQAQGGYPAAALGGAKAGAAAVAGSSSGSSPERPARPVVPGTLTGKTVSHYRVMELVGGGGMGMVYRAEDLKLGRFVAVKFLPEEFGGDPRALARFEREARAASSLEHPNICSIYEFGDHQGQPFLVMPLLKGQTLREYQAAVSAQAPGGSKALPLDQVLNFAIQIALGLEAAHEKGIIHRDIKPANIFITKKGTAQILDFGVAKVLQSDETDDAAADDATQIAILPLDDAGSAALYMTKTGVAIGTVSCMSPEQVRGEKVDVRTDLFSFGLLLYEMATGQKAFTGENAAKLKDAVLNQTPTPAVKLNPHIPPKLSAIIDKCLQKDRNLRYQSAAEIHRDLDKVVRARGRAAGRRWVLLATAAVVLVAAIAGGLYWRSQSRKKLTVKDTIVLTDFVNKTGDPVFDDALKQALAVQLGQSPFLNILSDRKVSATLKLMGRSPSQPVTMDVGRDVCLRTGGKAVLGGTISSLGSHYLIGLSAIACSTGDTLAKEQGEASRKEDVLKALSRSSSSLRVKLGESLPSVQKFDVPIEATTSSLEALQAYGTGVKIRKQKGDAAAIPFLQRAIELDPNFPMAYSELSIIYRNLRQPSRALEYATRAYNLRDRTTEREKLRISAVYSDDGRTR
jgi:eukaryotic-like serine/threonine-protein kinase